MTETAQATAPAAPAAVENTSTAPVAIDPSAPKPGEKIYEIKYPDGRVEKRGESWIADRAQKSIGLEQRVSAADKYEKAFTGFVARVQDPVQLIELLNHPDLKYDDDKQEALVKAMLSSKKPRVIETVKRWLYDNEVKPSMMDPKERELMEVKSEAEQLRQEKANREKLAKEAEETKNINEIKESYRVKLGESYQKSGLPVDDYLVRQVMEKARLYVRAGKHPDFDNCCKLVQTDFFNHVKEVLGKTTVENILTYMDGESAQKVNKALMNALNKKAPDPVVSTEKSSSPRRRKEVVKTPEEKKKWIRNLERGIID